MEARRAEAAQQLANDRAQLEAEKAKLAVDKAEMANIYTFQKQKIKLDIGGVRYATALSTITSVPDSFLATIFSGDYQLVGRCCICRAR